jgi:hypothetical protein
MIKVLPTGNHYPLQMAAEFYAIYRLLRAFLLLTPSTPALSQKLIQSAS